MTDETKSILMNREVIAIDQDAEYTPVTQVSSNNGFEMLMRPLHDGSVVVGLFNRSAASALMAFPRSALPADLTGKSMKVRDLWKHQDVPTKGDSLKATVPRHGVVLFKVSAE